MNPEDKKFVIKELLFFAGLSKKELEIIDGKSQYFDS